MSDEPLEDTLWVFPPEYYPWLDGINHEQHFPTPGINAENVHLVFNLSPFCTSESANKRFEMLVNRKPELLPRYFNREAFEQEIAEFPGDSFVIVAGPRKTPKNGEEPNLLWVVERRYTVLDRGAIEESEKKVVEVRGHYVIVADRIFAAPTLMDIVQSRWTASMLHLSTFYRTASSLPIYSIEKGYSYLAADQMKKPGKGGSFATSALGSARTSRAASPVAGDDTSSLPNTHHQTHRELNDDAQIAHSFNLTLSYSDEFMDENPLVGEPGSFKLTATGRSIREREAKERAAEEAREKARSEFTNKSEIGDSQRISVAPSSPSALGAKTNHLERKGTGLNSVVGKGKSPTSTTGEGLKKRRKSKAPITPGTMKSP
ncbi:uncharacterized protein PV09_09260 [Verruconis gallopava]|uniref:Mediator of RNA polymerase II transcription subunit 6 n=1 Tax=Verruconis gallopava TaxID=253628 RepID=A0A0D2AJF1_9PEZI|nr:uncharacterized protein PV09_09260 [Verruconis gallopava]KIV99033.1 hypothetical protein PV09_09260 [Verruconis gallopava]